MLLKGIFLGSGTGFWEFNYAGEAREIFPNFVTETAVLRFASWLVGCLFFCVDVVDGAQQCNVLQVISGDIDGIIHRYSCCAGFGFWSFSLFSCYVGCCIKCLRFSQERYTLITLYTFLLRQMLHIFVGL